MFKSIIDGTASAKDAFKQLAVVVIQEMQRILAVRMAASIIEAMTGMFMTSNQRQGKMPDGTFLTPDITIPDIELPARYGGTFGKKGYASGGIADGPQSGYNVLMHGREAIVPLPDGDRIPVQLTGKGQGPVNSVINVTVNNEGDVETSEEESTALGEAIQLAVTREISEQQRPGGLLSPI
jgi:phage-related minor tail protein